MLSGLENPLHLLVLFAIILIVMGPKRLPGLGRSLGSGIRQFKNSLGGHDDDQGHEPEHLTAPTPSTTEAPAGATSRPEHAPAGRE